MKRVVQSCAAPCQRSPNAPSTDPPTTPVPPLHAPQVKQLEKGFSGIEKDYAGELPSSQGAAGEGGSGAGPSGSGAGPSGTGKAALAGGAAARKRRGGGGAGGSGGEWQCTHCTLMNSADADDCGACSLPRPD